MNQNELKTHTKQFGLRVIRLTEALRKTRVADVIARQLLRSGTSVGANHRSACRARSRADFVPKIGIAIEEADESLYCMELIVEANLMSENRVGGLLKEANALTAIFTASHKTPNQNLRKLNRKSSIENDSYQNRRQ